MESDWPADSGDITKLGTIYNELKYSSTPQVTRRTARDRDEKRKLQSGHFEAPMKRPRVPFQWDEDTRRKFCIEVFQMGLSKSSPKFLLQLMREADDERQLAKSLTTEHLKSHLQKIRQHSPRSLNEFLNMVGYHVRSGNELDNLLPSGGKGKAAASSSASAAAVEAEAELGGGRGSRYRDRLDGGGGMSSLLPPRDERREGLAGVKMVDLLQQHADLQNEWMALQAKHQETLRQMQEKMQAIRKQYLEIFGQMRMNRTSYGYSPQHGPVTGIGQQSPGHGNEQHWRLQTAMQQQMLMHRQISSQKDDQTQIFHQGLAEASKSSGTNNNNNNGHAPEYPSPLQVDVQVTNSSEDIQDLFDFLES